MGVTPANLSIYQILSLRIHCLSAHLLLQNQDASQGGRKGKLVRCTPTGINVTLVSISYMYQLSQLAKFDFGKIYDWCESVSTIYLWHLRSISPATVIHKSGSQRDKVGVSFSLWHIHTQWMVFCFLSAILGISVFTGPSTWERCVSSWEQSQVFGKLETETHPGTWSSCHGSSR